MIKVTNELINDYPWGYRQHNFKVALRKMMKGRFTLTSLGKELGITRGSACRIKNKLHSMGFIIESDETGADWEFMLIGYNHQPRPVKKKRKTDKQSTARRQVSRYVPTDTDILLNGVFN